MEDKTYYYLLDRAVESTLINLFSISKDGEIRLANMNINNKKHWALLNIAVVAADIFKRKLYVDVSLWQFLKLRRRFNDVLRKRHNGGMECDRLIEDIEVAYETELVGIFDELYKEYYPPQKRA